MTIDSQRLLSAYDCLARTTGHMLSAAQSGAWDKLIDLERHCADLVARMSALETEEPLPEDLRQHKATMIRKVLADDAAIRNITEPWLHQLGTMLSCNGQERRLLHAYGPPREN
ncbi:MAG: flagellar protein FliT [Betaproteobacteria bacterium]|nr:flagellar protein FliT [Betaproteobacteria bacterium]